MRKYLSLILLLLFSKAFARTSVLPCSPTKSEALTEFQTISTLDSKIPYHGMIFLRRNHVPKVYLTASFKKTGVEINFKYGLNGEKFFQEYPKNLEERPKKYIWEIHYDNLRFFTRIYPEGTKAPAEWDLSYLFKKNPNLCGISLEEQMDENRVVLGDVALGSAGDALTRGTYFNPLPFVSENFKAPTLENFKKYLPDPIWEGDQDFIEMYWFAWEIALKSFRSPEGHRGTVSPYMDENFSDNFFQWDTAFMLQFGNYLYPNLNPIGSFDNFYNLQHQTGKIWKEYSEITGEELWDLIKGDREINPPLFAWAEWEAFKITGDKERLSRIFSANEQYLLWLEAGRKASGSPHRLYWNSPLGSGMDNIPVNWSPNHGWVDMSSQMVLAYKSMAKIAKVLGFSEKEKYFIEMAESISRRINHFMWDEKEGIYFDIDQNGKRMWVKHIGLFWPMFAGITSPLQEKRLLEHLKDPKEFNTEMPFPTLSRDNPKFRPLGNYWRGGVWAPTNFMALKGLWNRGHKEDAYEFSLRYLLGLNEVFKYTKTLWELYAPMKSKINVAKEFAPIDAQYFSTMVFTPGKTVGGFGKARPNFVGWTGVGPINFLLEILIGIGREPLDNKISWRLGSLHRHGIKNLPYKDGFISLISEERTSINEYKILVDTTRMSQSVLLEFQSGKLNRSILLEPGKTFVLQP